LTRRNVTKSVPAPRRGPSHLKKIAPWRGRGERHTFRGASHGPMSSKQYAGSSKDRNSPSPPVTRNLAWRCRRVGNVRSRLASYAIDVATADITHGFAVRYSTARFRNVQYALVREGDSGRAAATVRLTAGQLLAVANALDEVCNRIRELDDDNEFAARIGASRDEVRRLLAEFRGLTEGRRPSLSRGPYLALCTCR
jgi:hypothetical protein